MTLNELLHQQQWLSIETELLRLYPDQHEQIESYYDVYEQLRMITSESSDIIIRLTEITEDDETYVNVDGYFADGRVDEHSGNDALGLDFTPWAQWLGMIVDKQAFSDFTEPEIIAHCLYEMTFISFDQEDIQAQLENLKSTMNEYENMTPEERKKNTTSLEEFLKELGEDDDE